MIYLLMRLFKSSIFRIIIVLSSQKGIRGNLKIGYLISISALKTELNSYFLSLKPVNGYQARVPFRWSWKEGWETSMFLMPLRQPGKPVLTTINRTKKIVLFIKNKGQYINPGKCYIIIWKNYIIHTFGVEFENVKMW